MTATEWGWISKQLQGAGITGSLNDAAVHVLKCLRDEDLSDTEEQEVLRAVVALAAGHSIIVSVPGEKWGPVVPGAYSIGDTVRVKSDAFEGDRGLQHNGKRGRITAARDGFVRVLYDDSPSSDIQMHHRPETLERLR